MRARLSGGFRRQCGSHMVSFPLPFRVAACLQNRNRLKDLENKLMVTKGRVGDHMKGQTEGLGLAGVHSRI